MEKAMIRKLLATALAVAALLGFGAAANAQTGSALATQEGDFVVHDFHFRSGESLPELRLHYITLGAPRRDAAGHVVNAVLILHGTGGQGRNFIRPEFSGVLFGPGGLLDVTRYYVILRTASATASRPSPPMAWTPTSRTTITTTWSRRSTSWSPRAWAWITSG